MAEHALCDNWSASDLFDMGGMAVKYASRCSLSSSPRAATRRAHTDDSYPHPITRPTLLQLQAIPSLHALFLASPPFHRPKRGASSICQTRTLLRTISPRGLWLHAHPKDVLAMKSRWLLNMRTIRASPPCAPHTLSLTCWQDRRARAGHTRAVVSARTTPMGPFPSAASPSGRSLAPLFLPQSRGALQIHFPHGRAHRTRQNPHPQTLPTPSSVPALEAAESTILASCVCESSPPHAALPPYLSKSYARQLRRKSDGRT